MQTEQPRASPSRIDAAQSSRTRAAGSAKRALLSVSTALKCEQPDRRLRASDWWHARQASGARNIWHVHRKRAAGPIWCGVLAAAGPTLERVTLPSGIPIDELDPGIRPQDDLYRHVNGRWIARTEIPADRARDSTFRALADQAENAMREIVEEAASAAEGSEERKLGDLHASFMDVDRAELLGSQPIGQALAAARAVSSIPELLETLGRLQPAGNWGPVPAVC